MVYFNLFRWPNLVFVAALMVFFRFFIVVPLFEANMVVPALSQVNFFLLVVATVMICAAGYAINGYFDLRKDRINQPEKLIVGRLLARRSVIFWHWVLNTIGGIVGVYISWYIEFFPLALAFFLLPFLLWLYAFAFKRWFIFGNVFIATLSALIIYLVWTVEFEAAKYLVLPAEIVTKGRFYLMVYCGLLFFIFFALEVFKDFFHFEGDRKTGVRSFPVVLGVTMARNVFLGLLIVAINIAGIYVFWLSKNFYPYSVAFMLAFVMVPLAITIFNTYKPIEQWDPKKSIVVFNAIFISIVLSMVVQYFYII